MNKGVQGRKGLGEGAVPEDCFLRVVSEEMI